MGVLGGGFLGGGFANSVFGDGVLTRGTHGAVWGHKDDVGSGHYCTDLNLWIAAP